MERKDIERIIKQIQSGHFDRNEFPENMKGQVAKRHWNDELFTLGMEYGALLILLKLKKTSRNIKRR